MSGKISLVLGFHEHLSPGAGDDDFDDLYGAVLKPLVTALNDRPAIHAALHFSGSLLERLERKKREFFLLIGDLVSRKQIELLGGGFYEPLLPFLPLADKIGQIEMLTTYIRRHFGKKTQGCCLPFGIWEQSLAGALNSCGMAYTFLEAESFRNAGIEEDELCLPVLTEDQGKLVTVFPVFASLEDALRSAGSAPGRRRAAAVFSSFPRENGENGIGAFFEDLERRAAEKRFDFGLPAKVLRSLGPLKRACFSDAAGSSFHPRRFLTRCAEANSLYSKMYFVHSLINQLRGDKPRKQAAREELWKAQCADVFRQGPRGTACSGVRKYACRALLSAEKITREKGNFKPSLLAFDFDLDGQAEYLFQDKNINCYVKVPGASLFELDYLPGTWNYLDTFSGYGSYRRCAFMDRFFDAGLSSALAGVSGRFCADEIYEVSADKARGRAVFTLLPQKDKPFGGIEIQKTYQLEKNVLSALYTLTNRGGTSAFSFAPQIDLSFAGPEQFSVYSDSSAPLSPSRESPSVSGLGAFTITDKKNRTALNFFSEAVFDLYFFNNVVDNPEIYESSSFLPVFRLALENGESWSTLFRLSINAAKKQPYFPCTKNTPLTGTEI
jgi:hypothetical protein